MAGEPFYQTKEWKATRINVLARDNYLCQRCLENGILGAGTTVHHIKHLETHPELGLDEKNLVTLCTDCHAYEHKEHRNSLKKMPRRRARVIKG